LFQIWHEGLRAAINWKLSFMKEGEEGPNGSNSVAFFVNNAGSTEAERLIAEHLEDLKSLNPICPFLLIGLNCFAEVAVGSLAAHLLRVHPSSSSSQPYALLELVNELCQVFVRYSRSCRMALPASHLWNGLQHLLAHNNPGKARSYWQEVLKTSSSSSSTSPSSSSFERTTATRLLRCVLTSQDAQKNSHQALLCLYSFPHSPPAPT
jgi:hypothetical protein